MIYVWDCCVTNYNRLKMEFLAFHSAFATWNKQGDQHKIKKKIMHVSWRSAVFNAKCKVANNDLCSISGSKSQNTESFSFCKQVLTRYLCVTPVTNLTDMCLQQNIIVNIVCNPLTMPNARLQRNTSVGSLQYFTEHGINIECKC